MNNKKFGWHSIWIVPVFGTLQAYQTCKVFTKKVVHRIVHRVKTSTKRHHDLRRLAGIKPDDWRR